MTEDYLLIISSSLKTNAIVVIRVSYYNIRVGPLCGPLFTREFSTASPWVQPLSGQSSYKCVDMGKGIK